jgi:hypothetical protein
MKIMEITLFDPPYLKGEMGGKEWFWHLRI